MNHFRRLLISSLAALALAAGISAQEHPEHPSESKASAKPSLTIEQLVDAIERYVSHDADLKGGFFLMYDSAQDKTLRLTLSKIHKDKLASLGEEVYFACADFKSQDGHVYDLDIFMKSIDGELGATAVSVHKLDGKPRYSWTEEDGLWKKVFREEK